MGFYCVLDEMFLIDRSEPESIWGGFNGATGAQARGRLNGDASSYSQVFVRCITAQIRKGFQGFRNKTT